MAFTCEGQKAMENSTIFDGLSRWFLGVLPRLFGKAMFFLDHDPPEKSHRYKQKWKCR